MEGGRREVLVVIPESVADTAGAADICAAPAIQPTDASANQQIPADALTDTSDTSDAPHTPPAELSDEIQTTMLALHEDRIRRTDLAIMAYQQSVNVTAADARRAHRKARIAWTVAAGAAAAMFVSVVWATHSITRASAQVEHLNSVVRQLSDTADTRTRENDQLRNDAQDARIAAARVEGELSATRTAAADSARPTTQPSSATTQPVSVMRMLMDRVTMR
jgi:hypothetical protein